MSNSRNNLWKPLLLNSDPLSVRNLKRETNWERLSELRGRARARALARFPTSLLSAHSLIGECPPFRAPLPSHSYA